MGTCHILYIINIELKPNDIFLCMHHCVAFFQLIIRTVLHGFGICWLDLNLKGVQRLLVDIDGYCKNELNGGKLSLDFHLTENSKSISAWVTAAYCVHWEPFVELCVGSFVCCAYFLNFSPAKTVVAPVFNFFFSR